MTVWLNRGPKEGGWLWDGPHNVAPGAPGAKGINVFFGDINGESRAGLVNVRMLIITGDGNCAQSSLHFRGNGDETVQY